MDRRALTRKLADLAGRQHGVFTASQAADLGASEKYLRVRVGRGDLIRLSRNVLTAASAPPTWHRDVMAAVLSVSHAVAAGRSAAALHRLPGFVRGGRPEILVPHTALGRNPLAQVHRSHHFFGVQTTVVEDIPTISPAETVFAIANLVGSERLGRIVDAVLVGDEGARDELAWLYLRRDGERMRGMATLRPILLDRIADDYVPNQSELEHLLDVLTDHPEIPSAVRQHPLPWAPATLHRVDRFLPGWRAILEADGRAWHTRSADFERDRERDNLAAAHGITVFRFTWRMLTSDMGRCRSQLLTFGRRLRDRTADGPSGRTGLDRPYGAPETRSSGGVTPARTPRGPDRSGRGPSRAARRW